MFNDSLKCHINRSVGNTLEENWAQFTKSHHSWTVQPIIHKIARDLAGDDNDDEYREWLDILGNDDVNYQLQRTHDLESFETSFVHLLPEIEKMETPYCDKNLRTNKKAIGLQNVRTGVEVFYTDFYQLCKHRQFDNFHDLLQFYNTKDIEVMHPLISKMNENFKGVSSHCQMFRDNTSLPHISRNIGYEFAEREGGQFHLCKGFKEGDALERKIRRNLAGGPSIIFSRNLKAGDVIPGTTNTIKKIQCWDANALYPFSMSLALPSGANVYLFEPRINENEPAYMQWRKDHIDEGEDEEDNDEAPPLPSPPTAPNADDDESDWVFRKLGKSPLNSSFIEKCWIKDCNESIANLCQEENTSCQSEVYKIHTQSDNCDESPIRVGAGYAPDGIRYRCQFTQLEASVIPENIHGIVYEFLGSYYHGSPYLIKRKEEQLAQCRDEDRERKDRLTNEIDDLKKRYSKTIEKFSRLLKMGFAIKYEWENKFKFQGMTKEEKMRAKEHDFPPFTRGYITCDKKEKADYLSQLADATKFNELMLKDFDPYKIDKGEEQNVAFFGLAEIDISLPEHLWPEHDSFPSLFVRGPILENSETGINLRGLFAAEKVVLITPYIQYLVHLGYEVTRVYRCWEYESKHVLKSFVDRVTSERKRGDGDNANQMLAHTWKLIGNSFYGGCLMNRDAHSQIRYTDSYIELMRSVNQPYFIDHKIIDENLIEIEEVSKKIKQNIPVQLGKFILDNAKTRMAMFERSILQKYCDKNKYILVSMDTDSFTLAIAANDIHDIVLPDYREHWDTIIKDTWFVTTPERKREPGPMKLEYEGDKTVALSSKLFCVSNDTVGIPAKIASKGLRKRSLPFNPLKMFRATLVNDNERMKTTFGSIKRVKYEQDGRVYNKTCTTKNYRQVSNVYRKRELNDDGITTRTIRGRSYNGTPERELPYRFHRDYIQSQMKRKKQQNTKRKTKRQRREVDEDGMEISVECDNGPIEDEMISEDQVPEADLNEFLLG